jgi:UDP-N-acetylglucosamine:LPS N-acetylglucosamine transferase
MNLRHKNRPRVLAISSGGGHWIQLLRLRPAFQDCNVVYATVKEGYRSDLEKDDAFQVIPDSNLSRKLKLLHSAFGILVLLLRIRPDIVVSTGAAPGFFALHFAKALKIRTVWVDSIANAEELSLSGSRIGSAADLWLTQWPHLSSKRGPDFAGQVL